MKQLCMIILAVTALAMGGDVKTQKTTTKQKTATSTTKSSDNTAVAKKAVKTQVIAAKAIFRKTPSEKGAKIADLKKGDQIVVTNSVQKPFIKAKFNGKVGYVKINAIKRTDTINKWVGTNKVIASDKKKSSESKSTPAKSTQKSTTAKSATGDKVIGTYNGKKIYKGPKGGNYYVVNGKKTYLTKDQKSKVKPL